MSKKAIIQKLEAEQLKSDVPSFNVGDTVRVHIRIIEGDKERIQVFAGTVIARKGCGLGETFSVHRVAYGEGMERVFPLHSPRIAKIEVVREGDVRKSKLYYLRGTSGKKAKVKSKVSGAKRNTSIGSNGVKAPLPSEVEEVVDLSERDELRAIDHESEAVVGAGHSGEQAANDLDESRHEKADA